MILLEAIQSLHSVRRNKDTPLSEDVVNTLQKRTVRSMPKAGLNIQFVTDEPKAIKSNLSYGTF